MFAQSVQLIEHFYFQHFTLQIKPSIGNRQHKTAHYMAHPKLLLRFTVSRLRVSELCRDVGRSRDKLRDAFRQEVDDADGNAREPLLKSKHLTPLFTSNTA